MPQYWLFKSEPTTYAIEDFIKDKATWWEGVRNYQARNFMMKTMKVGDLVLFYHSSCEIPAIMGAAKVVEAARPDQTALDKNSDGFDPKATPENPIWWCVKIQYLKRYVRPVPLATLRKTPPLQKMGLLHKGSRLSVQPVTKEEYETIQELGS